MTPTPTIVIYHANCNDGFCAAWVARQVLGDGPDVEYRPAHYGQPPPDVAGKIVYLLDFSYPRPVLESLVAQAAGVCVLDHHQTAEAELGPLIDVYEPEQLMIFFDMQKSGARLTWECFFKDEPPPDLVIYTEDRDLWRFALPDSRAVNAALSSHPHDFRVWDDIHLRLRRSPGWVRFVHEGQAILRYQAKIIDLAVAAAREIDLDGHQILAVNSTVLFSEIAGKLAEGRPFGACWFQRGDGRVQWSLRSSADGIDVSAIARRHGGGGHRHAAGFEEDGRP